MNTVKFAVPARTGRRAPVLAAVLCAGAAVLALSGCGPAVKPNPSEKGAPSLTWTVLNTNTRQITNYPAKAEITWAPGDQYFILFKATDSGGIKSMSLGGGSEWTCVASGLEQTAIGDGAQQSATFPPSPTGLVGSYEFLTANEDPSLWGCESGFSFDGGSAAYNGKASNFANKTAQGTLVIVRNP